MPRCLGQLADFMKAVQFRDEVLIAGTGPSARALVSPELAFALNNPLVAGNPRWERLTARRTVILCNGAPDVDGADVFMAFDGGATERWWYRQARAQHYLLGRRLAEKKQPTQDWWEFNYSGSLFDLTHGHRPEVRWRPEGCGWKPGDGPQHGYLHRGASIVGAAYQLALHYYNVERIYLIGVEHCGNEKWDERSHSIRRSYGPLMDTLIERARRGNIYPGRSPVETFHYGPARLACTKLAIP